MEKSINNFELNQIEDKNALEEQLKLKDENNNIQLSDFNFSNGDNIYLENFLSKEFEELNKDNNFSKKFEEENNESIYENEKIIEDSNNDIQKKRLKNKRIEGIIEILGIFGRVWYDRNHQYKYSPFKGLIKPKNVSLIGKVLINFPNNNVNIWNSYYLNVLNIKL